MCCVQPHLKPRKEIKANASLGLLRGANVVATTGRLCGVDLGSCVIQRWVGGRIHQWGRSFPAPCVVVQGAETIALDKAGCSYCSTCWLHQARSTGQKWKSVCATRSVGRFWTAEGQCTGTRVPLSHKPTCWKRRDTYDATKDRGQYHCRWSEAQSTGQMQSSVVSSEVNKRHDAVGQPQRLLGRAVLYRVMEAHLSKTYLPNRLQMVPARLNVQCESFGKAVSARDDLRPKLRILVRTVRCSGSPERTVSSRDSGGQPASGKYWEKSVFCHVMAFHTAKLKKKTAIRQIVMSSRRNEGAGCSQVSSIKSSGGNSRRLRDSPLKWQVGKYGFQIYIRRMGFDMSSWRMPKKKKVQSTSLSS